MTGPNVPCRAYAGEEEEEEEGRALLVNFCWSSFRNANGIRLNNILVTENSFIPTM